MQAQYSNAAGNIMQPGFNTGLYGVLLGFLPILLLIVVIFGIILIFSGRGR